MNFGIFVFGDNHPEAGVTIRDYFENVLTMGEWAEELGFRSFWIAEHHFFWFGTCPSPQMFIVALGRRTKKLRLGPAVSVLPFRHPLITAEEYALADHLCGGRLEFAIGSGFVRPEYNIFGIPFEEGKERSWEAFDIIMKAWTENRFSHKGKFYQLEDCSLYMKPMQKPCPPTWVAASSDDSLIKAGKLGLPIMGIPFARSKDVEAVRPKHELFRQAYAEAGHKGKPEISVALHVHLDETEELAEKSGQAFFNRYFQYYKEHAPPGWEGDFDSLTRRGLIAYTSPDRASELFRKYEETGVTEVICMINSGGMPMENVRKTMELVSTEVMPRFQV